jgi:two-component system response regulator (stage 0 sporulation protein A)
MLKILIADNNVGLCETLEAFLERQEAMQVVGIAHDGEETLALIEEQRAGCGVTGHNYATS